MSSRMGLVSWWYQVGGVVIDIARCQPRTSFSRRSQSPARTKAANTYPPCKP